MKYLLHTAIFSLMFSTFVKAQCPKQNPIDEPVCLSKINIGGPRLGLTSVITEGDFAKQLDSNKIGRFYSQFGWQFEYKVVPEGNGPSFVIEAIPMLGAVEYGVIVPSLTVPVGIRFPNGWEFGIGPNATVVSLSHVASSVVIAVGKTFSYRGVGIPLNVAIAKGQGGLAMSMSFGYALVRSKSAVQGSSAY